MEFTRINPITGEAASTRYCNDCGPTWPDRRARTEGLPCGPSSAPTRAAPCSTRRPMRWWRAKDQFVEAMMGEIGATEGWAHVQPRCSPPAWCAKRPR